MNFECMGDCLLCRNYDCPWFDDCTLTEREREEDD